MKYKIFMRRIALSPSVAIEVDPDILILMGQSAAMSVRK